jgi:mannitol/fructose-specific phosphotransferase system IIA component (Ntr-type)
MNLAEILRNKNQIISELQAETRWEAIDELMGTLILTGNVKREERAAITALVKRREDSMTTGIGFGIGIPHASTDLIDEVAGAFGRSIKGVNFDAVDHQPVTLVMLYLVPQNQFQQHLRTLSDMAKIFRKEQLRQALQQARDAEEIFQIIRDRASEL